MTIPTDVPGRGPAAGARSSWWGDRGVKTKVLTAVGAASGVALVVGATAVLGLDGAAERSTQLSTQVEALSDVTTMRGAVKDARIKARDALIAVDPDRSQEALDALPGIADRFAAAREAYEVTDLSEEQQRLAAEAQDAFDQYLQAEQQLLEPLALANQYAAWDQANQTQVVPFGEAAEEAANELVEIEKAEAAADAQAAVGSAGQQRVLVLVVLAAGLAVAFGLGLLVARGLARGVARVQDVAEGLSAGDLTRSTGLTTKDEVGRMGAALDTAMTELRAVLASVAGASDAVAASSEELSASSAQISASAEETSAQSGVVAGAAEEVSRNVQTVAAGAEQMGASIREIASNAAEASAVAARAVTAAETTTATVAKLGESSAEIGNVVKVITSIAEQTNLLALNATIEAARAGEAGKGFAVVANEVKELAQETAKATEDIARRVQAIQADTGAAVGAIGEISQIVAAISDRQTTIASAVEEQTATTNEMSRSVQEAAQGSGQIADNITGVSTAAESTTQALTQTRTAVDELSRMAADLRTSVARFTY
ncbi:methyl-accepting chemotaxis protein [Geodermatophilus bullaregiensis]|nr:methyl-accepting chemotaxis protein [Geodermatophilus bullaregiensis]